MCRPGHRPATQGRSETEPAHGGIAVPEAPGANRESAGAGGGTRTPTGIRPTDFRTIYGFRRPAPIFRSGFVVWTIPSP